MLFGTGVLVGTGVSVDVGAGVLVGALTVNEPPLVPCGAPEPPGVLISVSARASGKVPGGAPGRMLNTMLTVVPTERRVGGLTRLNKITLTVPDDGSDEPRVIPVAAGPRLTLSTLTRLASKVRSKLRPLISTPGSNVRLTGMVRI